MRQSCQRRTVDVESRLNPEWTSVALMHADLWRTWTQYQLVVACVICSSDWESHGDGLISLSPSHSHKSRNRSHSYLSNSIPLFAGTTTPQWLYYCRFSWTKQPCRTEASITFFKALFDAKKTKIHAVLTPALGECDWPVSGDDRFHTRWRGLVSTSPDWSPRAKEMIFSPTRNRSLGV